MARITRDQILGSTLKEQEFPVPALGGEILMRELTVDQQDKIRESCINGYDADGKPQMDLKGFQRKLVMETMVDPKLQPGDFESLGGVGGAVFRELEQAAITINGLHKKLEQEIKN